MGRIPVRVHWRYFLWEIEDNDKNVTKDMTKGSPLLLLLQFTLPIFIGNLFRQLYNVVDTMIVGRLLGVNALAAVGSTGSLNIVLDYAMIVLAGLDVAGAAYATITSQAVSGILCFFYIRKKYVMLRMKREDGTFQNDLSRT